MSTERAPEYQEILTTVVGWPVWQRVALVQNVLRTVAPEPVDDQARRDALRRLNGMLAGYGPPPTDEDVERWLDERRMEKYG